MKIYNKRLIALLAALFIVAGLPLGVTGKVNAQVKRWNLILVAHGQSSDPFWSLVFKGAEDAAKDFSVDVKWVGGYPLPPSLDTAIAAKPDGLGITGLEPDGTRERLKQLAATGVPIILFNINDPNASNPDKRLPYLYYVGADEYKGSQSNARAILKAANAAGKKITRAMCLIPFSGFPHVDARCAGFADEMKAAGAVVDTIIAYPKPSIQVITDYFKQHPDCGAINTTGPDDASAFYLYRKTAKKSPGDVFHTTHDITSDVLDGIENGMTLQAVDQQPYYQGFSTVEGLWLYLNYHLVPSSDLLTGPRVVDKSNVAEIKDLVKAGYR